MPDLDIPENILVEDLINNPQVKTSDFITFGLPEVSAIGAPDLTLRTRVRGEELDTKIMQNTVEEGRKRYLEERKRAEQFSNASYTERLAMSGALSPEAIARNKAAYGITS